jgi:uncharacterized C2H2 Zn-finger protein
MPTYKVVAQDGQLFFQCTGCGHGFVDAFDAVTFHDTCDEEN